MATIEEVAALAGVSIATVSRVMNNSYVVSQEKRDKVLEVAKSLNYQTSRSLTRQAANRTILIAGSVFIYDIVAGIQHMAREHGFEVFFNFANSPENTLGSIGLVSRGMVDGMVLLNHLDRANELPELSRQIPIVHCGGIRHYPDSRIVAIDNRKAAQEATTYLFSIGRKRIGLVLPDHGEYTPDYIRDREIGYRMALESCGLMFDPSLIYRCDLSPEGFDEIIKRMKAQALCLDAIFCANDQLAVGMISSLSEVGLSVPGNVAVIGFDNDDISELCRPTLTTISQPRYEIGCECVRQLLTMINEDTLIGRQVFLAHELIIRGSANG